MSLIEKNGGYRRLHSFQQAQLIYDMTVRFCELYVSSKSRTNDQMVQAARSGVQNIAEGSMASATSKKTELKLTNVARASLEELYLDYEDHLRQHKLQLWKKDDSRRKEIAEKRFADFSEIQYWINSQHAITKRPRKEIAANTALVLIGLTSFLLNRQLARLSADFEQNGGFTEKLYRERSSCRKKI